MKLSHLLLLLLTNFFWSGVYSAYKIIERDLPDTGASAMIVTLRFGLGGLCLAALWPWIKGPAPKGRDFWITCLMGVTLFVVGQRLQVYGNEIGSAGNSSILMSVEPLLTSVGGAIFFRERIGPRRLWGFFFAICGVALLNRIWQPGFKLIGLVPSLIFISSFICEAAYTVMGKAVVMRASALKVVAISLLVALAVNLLIDGRDTVSAAARLSWVSWALLVALAIICTAWGYALWFVVVRDCPLNVAALTVFTQTVFGIMFAAFWVGEKLHWGHFFGSLVVAAGLALGLSRQVHTKKELSH